MSSQAPTMAELGIDLENWSLELPYNKLCYMLVTGFGHFEGVEKNPTEALVLRLDSDPWDSIKTGVLLNYASVVRVSTEAVGHVLDQMRIVTQALPLKDERSGVIWLHLGVNADATDYRIEAYAYNDLDFRIPDVDGNHPPRQPIVKDDGGVERARRTTINVEALAAALSDEVDEKVCVSHDPGRFLCNYIYYHALRQMPEICSDGHALFVHVPPFTKIGEESQYKFVRTLMEAIPEFIVDGTSPQPKPTVGVSAAAGSADAMCVDSDASASDSPSCGVEPTATGSSARVDTQPGAPNAAPITGLKPTAANDGGARAGTPSGASKSTTAAVSGIANVGDSASGARSDEKGSALSGEPYLDPQQYPEHLYPRKEVSETLDQIVNIFGFARDKALVAIQCCPPPVTAERVVGWIFEHIDSHDLLVGHADPFAPPIPDDPFAVDPHTPPLAPDPPSIYERVKLVLVVRSDLKMGKGKIAAQCCHGALAAWRSCSADGGSQVVRQWLVTGEAKVVLKCSGMEELDKVSAAAQSVGISTFPIQDAGRTQVEPGTTTVLALGPDIASKLDSVTGSLKLL